jgi:hypothetical protein
MSVSVAAVPTAEEHTQAFTEVAFLLDIFASTIDNIMGGATSSVGRIAGREMAKKLPIALVHPTPGEALAAAAESLKNGFDISFTEEKDQATITFGRCVIRNVCDSRQLQPGCTLCTLFHSYFDGIVNEIVSRPTKSALVENGDQCRLCMKIQ